MLPEDSARRPPPPFYVQGVAVLAYGLLYVPLLAIIAYSFIEPLPGQSPVPWQFSLIWYRQLFADAAMGQALVVSVQVALASTLIAALIGTLGALAIERQRFPGRALLILLTMLPLVMPELVLGLSSLIWFSVLRLTLGYVSIVLAHATFTVSYIVVTVRARLTALDPALEDAARDLGANAWQAFCRVTLPLMLPAIVAGATMAMALSFDDFLLSFFTAGVGAETLPVRLYGLIRFGLSREMYALSALLIAVTGSALLLAHRLRTAVRSLPL